MEYIVMMSEDCVDKLEEMGEVTHQSTLNKNIIMLDSDLSKDKILSIKGVALVEENELFTA